MKFISVSLIKINIFKMTDLYKIVYRIGSGVKEILQEEEAYKDRDAQIQAIEKTFEEAKKEITKHHTKPNVHPVEVMPIFPDFKVCLVLRSICIN